MFLRKATTFKPIIVLLLFAIMFSPGCAIVKINSQTASGGGSTSFNPTDYVNKIWDSKVIPYMKSNAISANTVLGAIKHNLKTAEGRYGIQRNGNTWNFIVTGSGTFTGYKANSGQGLANIQIPSGVGVYKIQMQTGPVIGGSAIRNSLKFITFGQVENQVQFAELSSAFNKKAYESTLKDNDWAKMSKQKVKFLGVLSVNTGEFLNAGQLVLTPVEFSKG